MNCRRAFHCYGFGFGFGFGPGRPFSLMAILFGCSGPEGVLSSPFS